MSLKTLIGSFLLVGLTACASTDSIPELPPERDVDTTGTMVCRVPLDIQRPSPIVWQDFEWRVLNSDLIKDMLERGDDVRYLALTHEDYQRLSLTIQDVLRYTRIQNAIIDEMDDYYRATPVEKPSDVDVDSVEK